ncbi:ABC transporter substrate-binding protein [Phytoactinopolyspora halotolerans]|uniref:ABC transporter substrate-binding protein n=1 Tax=Phytoactinopolyspora halotolerans TaxID=1981512 RepID=A0A6L9S775_9ACTN|nr:ABC transporter substrate-binding protein [Phytoactinopolyspora halotolerans]NEE01325.1 ABC transporter substrate-binding protein [Phytoactinopolyspora halotolerans]
MRREAITAGITVAALSMAACSAAEGGGDDGEASPDGLTPVTMGVVVTTSTVPIYVAQSEGIFADHGLEVELESVQNFAAAAPSLLNGQINFATAATAPVVKAIDQGMPLLAVAGTSATVEDPRAEGNQLVVRTDSGITDIVDMAGHTIGTNAVGSGPHAAMLASYLRAGGDPDAVEWVVMPMNEQVAALESGELDAAVLAEPFTGMALSDGHEAIFSAYREPGYEIMEPDEPYVVLLSSESYLAENAEVAGRVRDAIIEANQVAAEDPDLVIELLVSEAGMDPDVAEQIALPGFNGVLTGNEMQAIGDAMYEAGMIEQPFDGSASIWEP